MLWAQSTTEDHIRADREKKKFAEPQGWQFGCLLPEGVTQGADFHHTICTLKTTEVCFWGEGCGGFFFPSLVIWLQYITDIYEILSAVVNVTLPNREWRENTWSGQIWNNFWISLFMCGLVAAGLIYMKLKVSLRFEWQTAISQSNTSRMDTPLFRLPFVQFWIIFFQCSLTHWRGLGWLHINRMFNTHGWRCTFSGFYISVQSILSPCKHGNPKFENLTSVGRAFSPLSTR